MLRAPPMDAANRREVDRYMRRHKIREVVEKMLTGKRNGETLPFQYGWVFALMQQHETTHRGCAMRHGNNGHPKTRA